MMTSKIKNIEQAFVWIWLPGKTKPVVAGKLLLQDEYYYFTYGQTYLELTDAIPLSPFELPLQSGTFKPQGLNRIHSCLRDAAPDAWGRQLIQFQYPAIHANELDYLLLSGSDRIGALDFQLQSDVYIARDNTSIGIDAIQYLGDFLEQHKVVDKVLLPILLHGTSIGGARPKCLIVDEGEDYVAKFSLSTDIYSIVKAEFIAMRLAKLVGIDVAEVKLKTLLNRDILLVKRFDRNFSKQNRVRHSILSGLSLLDLNEMEARYASYKNFADIIRQNFVAPKKSLKELFQRLVFNVLIGNTDDHARNHSAFWDGEKLKLTPAYDICPQLRAGGEATQAMAIGGVEGNFSTLKNVRSIAPAFLVEDNEAKQIIERQYDIICKNWNALCEEANLKSEEKEMMWGRVICSDFSLGPGLDS